MMWWNGDGSWLSMWLLMGISFVGLVLLIVLALRAEFTPWTRQPVDRKLTDAREVLALRLARGDIDTDEYLSRINALSETNNA